MIEAKESVIIERSVGTADVLMDVVTRALIVLVLGSCRRASSAGPCLFERDDSASNPTLEDARTSPAGNG